MDTVKFIIQEKQYVSEAMDLHRLRHALRAHKLGHWHRWSGLPSGPVASAVAAQILAQCNPSPYQLEACTADPMAPYAVY